MQCPLNPHTIETESRNVCRLDSLSAALRPSAFATALSEAALLIKHGIMLISRRPALHVERSGAAAIFLFRKSARGKFRSRIGRSRDNPEGVSTMISMRDVTLSNAISHNWILLNRPAGPRGIARGLSDPPVPSPPLPSDPSRASCESLFPHSRRRGCKSDYEPRRGMGEYVKRIIKPLPRKSSSDDYIFVANL